jgi:hypothetical protein
MLGEKIVKNNIEILNNDKINFKNKINIKFLNIENLNRQNPI